MEKPVLHLVDEFSEVLDGYQVSDRAHDVLDKIDLVLLRGPSGAGRNTIIDELVETANYASIVSDTTRPKRTNDGKWEQDGHEYWFRTEAEVLEDLRGGEFLEAEIIHNQQVSGISIRVLEEALNKNQVCINEVHFGGAENVAKLKKDARIIFVTPPNFDEWMERFRGRGGMTEAEIQERIGTALKDYEHALSNDYYKFVINDKVPLVAARIRQIAEAKDYPEEENAAARKVSEGIYSRLLEHSQAA